MLLNCTRINNRLSRGCREATGGEALPQQKKKPMGIHRFFLLR